MRRFAGCWGLLAVGCMALLVPQARAEIVDVAVGAGGQPAFAPQDIVVSVGDTVRWTWETGIHNVVSGPPRQPDGAFSSGNPSGQGTVFEVVFDQAFLDTFPHDGNFYPYYCDPHAGLGMVGSVTVEVVVPGDMNCDGALDGADIDPFFLALGEPDTYMSQFPDCDLLNGDVNDDGSLDGADIDIFFQCLSNGECP